MIYCIFRTTKKDSGFTIVEVLIALTIFSIAIAGVITAAVQGGLDVNKAKNRVVAGYLADEGLELVRGLRDTMVVQNAGFGAAHDWAGFLTAIDLCTHASGGTQQSCDIDAENTAGSTPFPLPANIIGCVPLGSACPLYYDTHGYYTHVSVGAASTSFSRGIHVTEIAGSGTSTDEVHVVSTVSWYEGITQQSVSVSEDLFNWYAPPATP